MRGKHTTAAQNRAAKHDLEISVYRNKVAKLTAENKALKAAQHEQAQQHARSVARLKGMIAEAASPMIGVLQDENRRHRDERDAAVQQAREIRKHWQTLNRRLWDVLVSLGLSRNEAIEMSLYMIDGRRVTLSNLPQDLVKRLGGPAALEHLLFVQGRGNDPAILDRLMPIGEDP